MLDPLGTDEVSVTNLSNSRDFRLDSGCQLCTGEEAAVALPLQFELGGRVVVVRTDESPKLSFQSISEQTVPPGGDMILDSERPDLRSIERNVGSGDFLRWLQESLLVLQSAATADDFLQRAAETLVKMVNLHLGAVLLKEDSAWNTKVMFPENVNGDQWRPSKYVIDSVCRRRTAIMFHPISDALAAESLQSLDAVVAAPILGSDGDVLGVLYGERRERNDSQAPKISRLEAQLVALLASAVAAGLARVQQERAALEMRVRFDQFFSPGLSQKLRVQPNLLSADGEQRNISAMFVDIRGFSKISNQLGPSRTIAWLTDCLNVMSDIVLAHEGVLVDYIGDELMAIWGAPDDQPDHADRACNAAIEIIEVLPELNQRWSEKIQAVIDVGIGINSGPAVVGNVGTQRKFKYGALGETVNVASRVQGLTKYLNVPLAITQATRESLEDQYQVRRLCSARVVNISDPVDVYQVTSPEGMDDPLLRDYEKALCAFESGEFLDATRILGEVLSRKADDGPSLMLMSRSIASSINASVPFDPIWIPPGK
ncbi:MAG: adenylate/guanylate cyclase domain-containing protein [Pirellulales bacterium]